MIYRKQSPTPPRLLLRIVGTAGAGTLLGMAACGSPSPDLVGSAPALGTNDGGTSSDGASDSAPDTIFMGSLVTGSVACPADGSEVVGCPGTFPDASDDATASSVDGSGACPPDASGIEGCPIVTGLVVSPNDASDDAIVNGLVVHPGDSG